MIQLRMALAILILFAVESATAARVEILDGENYDLVASTSRGLRFRVKDPDLVFRLGGRIHGDLAVIDEDRAQVDNPDGRLRRARLYLSGRLFDDFGFKIEREFAPDRGEFRNLWVGYNASNRVSLKAGNFVAPFGLEQIGSSNLLTFMERSMSGAIGPSFQSGVRIDTNWRLADRRSRHRMTWSLYAGTTPLGQTSDDPHRSEHWNVVTRMTYAPIARTGRVVHLGGAAEYRDVLGEGDYRIRTRVESSEGPSILNTGNIADTDSVVSAGAELGVLFGPVLLQGEYHHAFLQRETGREDVDFGGGYVQASWVVTGEAREYSRRSGVFGGLRPDSDWGALELAARFSSFDLDDGPVEGGEAQNWTVGANWYVRENLRFMFNYVRVNAKQRVTGASDDPQIFQLRASLFF